MLSSRSSCALLPAYRGSFGAWIGAAVEHAALCINHDALGMAHLPAPRRRQREVMPQPAQPLHRRLRVTVLQQQYLALAGPLRAMHPARQLNGLLDVGAEARQRRIDLQ